MNSPHCIGPPIEQVCFLLQPSDGGASSSKVALRLRGQVSDSDQPPKPDVAKLPMKIEKTEERAITLMQLTQVMEVINTSCTTWVDNFPGSPDFGKPLVATKV